MLDCLILGDSIAVGSHTAKPECVAYAKGGINSWQFNKMYLHNEFYSGNVIISLGTNDHKYVNTRAELEKLRSRVLAKNRVYWILPAIKPEIQQIVQDIAQKNGDIVLPITRLQPDGIHPSGREYKELMEKVK